MRWATSMSVSVTFTPISLVNTLAHFLMQLFAVSLSSSGTLYTRQFHRLRYCSWSFWLRLNCLFSLSCWSILFLRFLLFSWIFLISVFSSSFSASTSKTRLSILSTLLCRLSITRYISALNWFISSFVASESNFLLKTSRLVTVESIFFSFSSSPSVNSSDTKRCFFFSWFFWLWLSYYRAIFTVCRTHWGRFSFQSWGNIRGADRHIFCTCVSNVSVLQLTTLEILIRISPSHRRSYSFTQLVVNTLNQFMIKSQSQLFSLRFPQHATPADFNILLPHVTHSVNMSPWTVQLLLAVQCPMKM